MAPQASDRIESPRRGHRRDRGPPSHVAWKRLQALRHRSVRGDGNKHHRRHPRTHGDVGGRNRPRRHAEPYAAGRGGDPPARARGAPGRSHFSGVGAGGVRGASPRRLRPGRDGRVRGGPPADDGRGTVHPGGRSLPRGAGRGPRTQAQAGALPGREPAGSKHSDRAGTAARDRGARAEGAIARNRLRRPRRSPGGDGAATVQPIEPVSNHGAGAGRGVDPSRGSRGEGDSHRPPPRRGFHGHHAGCDAPKLPLDHQRAHAGTGRNCRDLAGGGWNRDHECDARFGLRARGGSRPLEGAGRGCPADRLPVSRRGGDALRCGRARGDPDRRPDSPARVAMRGPRSP